MESAIQIHDERASEEQPQPRAEVSKIKKFTALLRRGGALVLVAAALSFLIQGWNSWNSYERYFTFLAFTATLTGLGLLCGLRWKEDKGARTFLGLAAAFLPVLFAQVAAFVRSLFGPVVKGFPQSLVFIADSLPTTAAVLVGTVVLAVPLAFLAFSTLAREQARRLTVVYLLTNIALLSPLRDPRYVFILGAIEFSALIYLDFCTFSRFPGMKTFEGRVSRGLPFLPLLILLGRCAMYGVSLYLNSLILGALSAAIFLYADSLCRSRTAALKMRLLSLFPAYWAWQMLITAVLSGTRILLPTVIVQHVPFAALVFALSLVADEDGPLYRRVAGFLALAPAVVDMCMTGGFALSAICILLSLIVLCSAFAFEEKALFYFGVFGFAAGILVNLRYANMLYQLSPWITLAAIGISAVIAASYMERNYQRLLVRSAGFRESFRTWR
jgi:hypothetical protein